MGFGGFDGEDGKVLGGVCRGRTVRSWEVCVGGGGKVLGGVCRGGGWIWSEVTALFVVP